MALIPNMLSVDRGSVEVTSFCRRLCLDVLQNVLSDVYLPLSINLRWKGSGAVIAICLEHPHYQIQQIYIYSKKAFVPCGR